MKGKREKRRALKAWRVVYFDLPTNPDACECHHDGLPAVWHMSRCPVSVGTRAVLPL